GYKIVHVVAAAKPKTTFNGSEAIGDRTAPQRNSGTSDGQVGIPKTSSSDVGASEESLAKKILAKSVPAQSVADQSARPSDTAAAPETSAGGYSSCKENPSAMGTSRTIVIDPINSQPVGTLQFSTTLPLQDHEVVLTFDDGPLSPET